MKIDPIDWPAIIAGWRVAFQDLAETMTRAGQSINSSMLSMTRLARESANDEVRVSGLEALFYVRAGMGLPDIDALDHLVREILRAPTTGVGDSRVTLRYLTPGNRLRLVQVALRGWAVHQGVGDVPVLAWHRHFGSAGDIYVGRS